MDYLKYRHVSTKQLRILRVILAITTTYWIAHALMH